MKKLNRVLNYKFITRTLGVVIGIVAIYFSLRNIQGKEVFDSLKAINASWIIPIIIMNFMVIAVKALRWKIMITPIKKIRFLTMFRVLTIGFMANSVLPARLGEAVRVDMLGRDEALSRVTTAATVVADRIIEAVSFLLLAAILVFMFNVPEWMHKGLIITLCITIFCYGLVIFHSKRKTNNKFLKKLQDGAQALLHMRLATFSFLTSLLSWFLQGLMLYMTQLAFGVHLPIWGIILVLLAINLAVALPAAPGYVGTFEFACILAYSYLGLDKNIALLVGATFHILQIVPITLVGGILMLTSHFNLRKPAVAEDPGVSRSPNPNQ